MIKIDPRSGKNHEWTNRRRKKKAKLQLQNNNGNNSAVGGTLQHGKPQERGKALNMN